MDASVARTCGPAPARRKPLHPPTAKLLVGGLHAWRREIANRQPTRVSLEFHVAENFSAQNHKEHQL
jgi:hypothetical protein